ncbi:MAG: PCMD domain-containing protein, partial [Duncaniella sp.]|nr:PCMD domain-containing protein [Duncaniella sp.]
NMRINFEEFFTNTLAEGTYEMKIVATDGVSQETEKTFVLEVSGAPVQGNEVSASSLGFTSATLTGTILDNTASGFGFELRQAATRSYEDWTPIAATVNGSKLTATVNDLVAGTTYEYRVVATKADGTRFEGKTLSFETVSYPQLPNGGFEDWSGSSPMFICANEASMFWDSGNHGSKTMGKDVTEKDTSVKHSGNYSAKLKSQFVGLGSIGRFAAGNAFVGKYLKTDGTDGILGWGRPWNPEARPKALKGWIKYSPGTVQDKVFTKVPNFTPSELKEEFPTGSHDKAIIYIALVDHSKVDVEYKDFPVIIKTKVPQLFDKNGSNVKAYGEMIVSEATPGDDMIEFTINLTDVNPGAFSHIMIVASASKAGDYFLGGEGSTLW